MKTLKCIFTAVLLMSASAMYAQKTAAGQMQVEWTTDIVLGKGYTITKTFEADGANFIICYNANSGKTQIWNLDKGGLPVYDKTTHKGWTSLVYFQLNNKTYMFSYKEASGEVIFFEMSNSGISKRVGEYSWSKGWNGFDVLYRNNEPTIIMTRASDGRAKFFKPHF